MFSAKNLSPQQLSALTALTLSVPITLGLYFFNHTWWVTLISFFVIFLGSFGLILFTLQTFIYRKIKLIYKLIYQTKASKREEFYYKNILPQKSIDEVREDVEKWAEQRKEEIELLQQNEAFRKEFLQNLSHELKTPIFAIQGYVDTLLNGALHNNDVNKKFLQSTSRNIDRLVNLVDDLDEISRLESGEQKLHYQDFIIQDLVKEVYDTLYLTAKEKEIRCVIKKGCEFPLAVNADKEKIRQVLINLVENAIKYGKQHGMVEASFYNVDGKNVLVEISDDGSGIAEEHLPRLFERFYRTDLARSRKVGGSGLGLSICKHIIEAHNQTIHVRSKIDVGSTFGFTLAAKKQTIKL
ncbi:cell wall metabolism sensor histidine kinase WalK [Ferruginibacter sp. HRS2-29]|uniref:sensor histidine kinase n=1 Tax=Ferruginibacter sp. HRS2-29 TaxID=2487334 RepID=UPI0020CBA692|nr:ATP-binding protein [Ferruginibacter sp. HRS2-29]MCP9751641.1 sensor histidine kinase [Ferruginibacter sp. HRS2-29]